MTKVISAMLMKASISFSSGIDVPDIVHVWYCSAVFNIITYMGLLQSPKSIHLIVKSPSRWLRAGYVFRKLRISTLEWRAYAEHCCSASYIVRFRTVNFCCIRWQYQTQICTKFSELKARSLYVNYAWWEWNRSFHQHGWDNFSHYQYSTFAVLEVCWWHQEAQKGFEFF